MEGTTINLVEGLTIVVALFAVWSAVRSSRSAEKSANAAKKANELAQAANQMTLDANNLTRQALEIAQETLEATKTAYLKEARTEALRLMEFALYDAIDKAVTLDKWPVALQTLANSSPRSLRDLPNEIIGLYKKVYSLLSEGNTRDLQFKQCMKTHPDKAVEFTDMKFEIADKLVVESNSIKSIFNKYWPEIEEDED